MRILLVALLIASCTDPVGQDERDPGFPDDQPFDSVATDCAPADTTSTTGHVPFVCP